MKTQGISVRLSFLRIATILGILCLCLGTTHAQSPSGDSKAMDSYSLGYEFGSNARKQPVELDLDTIIEGVRDAYKREQPRFSEHEMKEALGMLKKRIWTAQQLKYSELADKNLKEGEAFLTENAKKPGVVTLPSGLQYKVILEGNGPSPAATDKVKVQYRGTLVNGTEFDSSFARGEPASVGVSGVVRGWTEVLQLMKVGSKWQAFIPAKLAYGNRSHGRIPPQSALIFEIELLSIEKPAEKAGQSGPVASTHEEQSPVPGEAVSQTDDEK